MTNTRALLLVALASCFMVIAHAAAVAPCFVCLYADKEGSGSNPAEGDCLMFYQSGNAGSARLSTPFVSDNGEKTINAFRSVGLTDCEYCTLTAYASADFTGKNTIIQGSTPNSSLDFCAKSFELFCDSSSVGQPEEEEEEEEQEM